MRVQVDMMLSIVSIGYLPPEQCIADHVMWRPCVSACVCSAKHTFCLGHTLKGIHVELLYMSVWLQIQSNTTEIYSY